VAHWYAAFDAAGVPSGPINTFEQVFADPQIVHREMLMHLPHAQIGALPQVANPVKFSATPVHYRRAPPLLGEHTVEVLADVLGMDEAGIARLRQAGVV
jgi:crotonobetainyl-CoA:carnitine CoA-transferase CaiB-like acyl-CoA transferase